MNRVIRYKLVKNKNSTTVFKKETPVITDSYKDEAVEQSKG